MFDLNFIKSRIGNDFERMLPRCQRLADLYSEVDAVKQWLDANKVELMGDKVYKEFLATYNGLMANIFKLEDSLNLFRESRELSDDVNDVADMLGG